MQNNNDPLTSDIIADYIEWLGAQLGTTAERTTMVRELGFNNMCEALVFAADELKHTREELARVRAQVATRYEPRTGPGRRLRTALDRLIGGS